MANVQLPSINITPGDIDSASLPELQKIVKNLLNTTAILTEELTFLLNNLDTRNVNEIDGDVLVDGTVTAKQIAAHTITANEIAAHSITANEMNVQKLSAIAADLGHIIAGVIEAINIYGSYIYGTEIEGGRIRGATISTRNGNSKGIVMNSEWADLEIYSGSSSIRLTFAIEDLANDVGLWFARDGRINAGREIHINAPDGVFVNNVRIG